MKRQVWRWVLGLLYILAVATIWIAASFVVQSVVDAGVSPFLITYLCNSLFVIYIPFVEAWRYLEDSPNGNRWFHRDSRFLDFSSSSEQAILLRKRGSGVDGSDSTASVHKGTTPDDPIQVSSSDSERRLHQREEMTPAANRGLDAKGRWTRFRVAKASLLVCPSWFLAQLTFNLSLKYTTVTSNTILSSSSSLFTFMVSLAFLGEKFTWVKLISVLLCMSGTIIVSLGDSKAGSTSVAANPVLGDILAVVSAGFYSVYITLIRKNLRDENDEEEEGGQASMAQFLGYLGLFNLLIFLPVALVLNVTKVEPFHALTRNQLVLIVGKGLLDNVLSDYMWAKAVLLTSTTVATAGLTIQVPLAAAVDTLRGNFPHLMDYIGAVAVLLGFAGLNVPQSSHDDSTDAPCLITSTTHS